MVSGGSGSEKREEREGLSEGVGFHRSCAWHSTWVDFFRLFFLFFWRNNRAFGIGMVKFGPVLHFRYFSSFSRIFPHLFSFCSKPTKQNTIK